MIIIPSSWSYVPIGNLCNLVNGRAFKPSDWGKEGLPIVRIQNLNDPDANFNYYSGSVEEKFLIGQGQLLFAWSGTPGTSFGAHIWNGGKAVLNQHIFKVEFDDSKINKKYLCYAINQKLNELIEKAHGGVGLRHVTKGKFEQTEILIPPLNEQSRIVAKIEELFSELDKGIESLKTAQEQLKTCRLAVLKHVFEGKLTAHWREDNLETIKLKDFTSSSEAKDFPKLPKRWLYTQLGEVIDNPNYGTSKKCDYDVNGIGVLRIPNIVSGIVDSTDLKFANFDANEINTYKLIRGDILTIRSNGSVSIVGKCALIREQDEKFLYAGYLIRLRPNKELISPEFLNYVLSSHMLRTQIERKAKSTSGVNNINAGELQSLIIPVCGTNEQEEIVKLLKEKISIIDHLEKTIEEELQKSEALHQSILKKAFSGKLVAQDPNDEPASVLLERIRTEKEVQKTGSKKPKAINPNITQLDLIQI